MSDGSGMKMTSNKPYLVGAFYDWISDNEMTPFIVFDVSVFGVLVPMAYVKDGQIVLNIAASAVGSIALGENAIEFSARFGGKLEHMTVPYGAIAAIYAKENGAGTSLPIEHPSEDEVAAQDSSKPDVKADLKLQTKAKPSLTSVSSGDKASEPKKSGKGKASLTVIK